MTPRDQPAPASARLGRMLAVATVLLAFWSGSGCGEKPALPAGQPAVSSSSLNPDGPAAAKHKRIPRTPK